MYHLIKKQQKIIFMIFQDGFGFELFQFLHFDRLISTLKAIGTSQFIFSHLLKFFNLSKATKS